MKAILAYIALVFVFPIFYIFVPIYIAYGINVFIIIASSYMFWKKGEKKLVILTVTFFAFNTWFLIRWIGNLQLLTIDPVEYMRIGALIGVITRFIEYLPLLIIFFIAFGVLYVWSFITTRGASTHRFAILLGYMGLVIVFILIALDMFFFTIDEEDIVREGFEIVLFGGGAILSIPFELYYFIQISIWSMSSFSFVVGLLSNLAGGGA